MSLGSLIVRLRTEKGWTQSDLANQVEMNYQHIYRIEKDHFRPRPKTLAKLAQVLGVTTDTLVAAMTDGIPTRLTQEDPELADLMTQITTLDDEKISALKTFLKALLTCQQVQSLAKGPLSRAS